MSSQVRQNPDMESRTDHVTACWFIERICVQHQSSNIKAVLRHDQLNHGQCLPVPEASYCFVISCVILQWVQSSWRGRWTNCTPLVISSGAPAGRQDRHPAKAILLVQVNESLVDFEPRDWLEQKQRRVKCAVSDLGPPTSKHWMVPGSFTRFRHLRDYSLRRNTSLRIPFNDSHATNQKYRFDNVRNRHFFGIVHFDMLVVGRRTQAICTIGVYHLLRLELMRIARQAVVICSLRAWGGQDCWDIDRACPPEMRRSLSHCRWLLVNAYHLGIVECSLEQVSNLQSRDEGSLPVRIASFERPLETGTRWYNCRLIGLRIRAYRLIMNSWWKDRYKFGVVDVGWNWISWCVPGW